jgi:tRNA G18 (ribose-2'-O)-methylase SpoU
VTLGHPHTITDPSDIRLVAFRRLPDRPHPADGFIVEGALAVDRLLEARWPVHAVLCTPAASVRLGDRLADTEVYEAPGPLIREVVGFDLHRGVVAWAPRPDLTRPPLEAATPHTVVVAERLADPSNLGALLRNARAFGADLVVCDPRGADPLSRRAIRAAMGHTFTLPLWIAPPAAAFTALRERMPELRGVAATLADDATPLPHYKWADKVALMVGNEGSGLSAELRARAHDAVTLPMAAGADSLNVAAATAVFLYSRAAARNRDV